MRVFYQVHYLFGYRSLHTNTLTQRRRNNNKKLRKDRTDTKTKNLVRIQSHKKKKKNYCIWNSIQCKGYTQNTFASSHLLTPIAFIQLSCFLRSIPVAVGASGFSVVLRFVLFCFFFIFCSTLPRFSFFFVLFNLFHTRATQSRNREKDGEREEHSQSWTICFILFCCCCCWNCVSNWFFFWLFN